jgi:hypothetical protein
MANNDNAANVKIEGEMHLVITGRVAPQYIEHSGNSQIISMIEIGTSNISKAVSSAGKDLDNIGMVSLDQLFCPYMIGADWATHESLPYWHEPTSAEITATDLNPFNPGKVMTNAATFYQSGPNVSLYNSVEFLNGEQIGSGDFCQYKNIYPTGSLELNSVKGVGFKAPLILTGWGYDINDNPVPADSGNPTAFASGAFRNPALWKSGPLDARWDEARQVWSAGVTTGTTSGGDCNCGCSCAEGYDLVLPDGTKTTRVLKWVPPSDLEIDVANGHIWLPQANEIDTLPNLAQYYPLVHVSGSAGTWTLNASGYLKARYSDYINESNGTTVTGTVATTGVVKTGSITFMREDTSDSDLMSLTVTINGTISPSGS